MADFPLGNGYYDLPPGKLVNLVTCLEMRAAPALSAPAWPPGVTLRRLGARDVGAMRDVFRRVGQDLLWFSRLIMPEAALAQILADGHVESLVLLRGDEAIGLLELDFRKMPDCELSFFGLVPGAVGSGLGRLLMQEALWRAWSKPISRLWVHTCHYDHPRALGFYQASGFKISGLMVEVHDDPRLTGHLPLDAAPHVPLSRR